MSPTPDLEQIDIGHGDPWPVATATSDSATPTPVRRYDLESIAMMCDGPIVEVLWLNNDIFAYACSISEVQPLRWIAYDVTERSETEVSSPLNYNNAIWSQLGLAEPWPITEVRRYVSPSNGYVLHETYSGEPFTSSGRTEIWLIDTFSQRRVQIYEDSLPGLSLFRADWFDDESRVTLSLGYEGSPRLCVVDVGLGEIIPFWRSVDVESIEEGILPEWAVWEVSPDGRTLALRLRISLLLISLEDGRVNVIEEFDERSRGYSPHWSKDGQTVYYWGEQIGNRREICAYDTITGDSSVVVIVVYPDSVFNLSLSSVSPQGDKLLFLGNGRFYLITLNG